jgi:acyl carrier protein
MFRKIQTVISKAGKAPRRKAEAEVNADDSASLEMSIKAIMAKVFKIDINEINEETSADTIDQWTSLEHVDFLVKLQQEFDIELTDSQIVEMLSYKAVVQNIEAALANQRN